MTLDGSSPVTTVDKTQKNHILTASVKSVTEENTNPINERSCVVCPSDESSSK